MKRSFYSHWPSVVARADPAESGTRVAGAYATDGLAVK
jgi:hypothetical protein